MVAQRFSACLPLVALLISFPCSQAGEADMVTRSSVLSDVLHKYFDAHMRNGKAMPRWKPEVDAVLSLVDSMKDLQDIKPSTQTNVNKLVDEIIVLLQGDEDGLKKAQDLAQKTLSNAGTQAAGVVATVVEGFSRLKNHSSEAHSCHDKVTRLETTWEEVHRCSATDIEHTVSACNCSVNNVFDFQLTPTAKALHWCEFAADPPETAQSCINELWAEVNNTRLTLKADHTKWLQDKKACKDKRDKCLLCEPLWITISTTLAGCKAKHEDIYDQYHRLQKKEENMCAAEASLDATWGAQQSQQTERVQEWKDLKFVICIFEKYKESGNFTQASFNQCLNAETTANFYTAAGGELVPSQLSMVGAPTSTCVNEGTTPQTVKGLEGLLHLWTVDGCGDPPHSAVTLETGNVFKPVSAQMGACKGSD